jgi:hypothetical protein
LSLYSEADLCYGKPELKLSSELNDEALDPEAAILPNRMLCAVVHRDVVVND